MTRMLSALLVGLLTAVSSPMAESSRLVAEQQAPDRTKTPVPGDPPALTLPPIHKRTLGNGLPVWVVESREVPVVNITLIVKTGASADPMGQFGLASFTAAMLDEGAGSRDALELADAVEFLGASLTTSSAMDSSTVRLQTPVSKLDAALPLLADVVLRPSFPANELERLRQERLTSLLQTRDNPSALAAAAFSRVLYGPRHRYGTAILGNDASIGEMSAENLRTFYRTYYQPQNAHLLVVGDVTADDIVERIEKALGAWTGSGPVRQPALPAVTQHAARQIYLVDKPGAQQSQIRIGWIGVNRRSPDYHVLEVLNTILGGSFTSRLNQNLRERNGYAYGAGSSFDMRVEAGPFLAAAGVQSDKTAEALREFFNELDGMHQPVPADELSRGRNLQALGFPASFETTAGVAGNLSELVVYGLPETTFEEFVPKIQAVTSADLARAAKQYLQTDKFAVIIVGDLSTIEKPIRDGNFGPVRVLTLDEILK
ncbi:MAG TPA: pitrilysin family protein [Vicinamibacterales bacterium]|nr:pitrilysin family protein [Vicinamibacterales bacterium]